MSSVGDGTAHARFVDTLLVEGETVKVFAYDRVTDEDCGGGPRLARLVDQILVESEVLTIPPGLYPAYFVPPPCTRRWEGPVDYVDYDLGNDLPLMTLPVELSLVFEGMTECLADGEDCVAVTLTFDEGEGKWLGEHTWSGGGNGATVPYEFYGYSVVEGEEVVVYWVLHSLGCFVSEEGGIGVGPDPTPDGIYEFFEVGCENPLRWDALFTSQYGYYNCCCNTPFTEAELTVYAKTDPTTLGRLVDHVDGKDVYLVHEGCPECPCNAACCPGTPFDGDTEWTLFNFVTTDTSGPFPENCGDCSSAEEGDELPLIPGNDYPRKACRDVNFLAGCFTGASVCVYCAPGGCGGSGSDGGEDHENGWMNYRLYMQTDGVAPVPDDYDLVREPDAGFCGGDGSFSATWLEVPFRVETSGAICDGHFSVTISRGGCG